MKQHRYAITVEHLTDANGGPSSHEPLRFEVGNHDDIIAIVERMRRRSDLTPDTATALAVGIKLFGEVILENRKHPLFSDMWPAFAEFMKKLKRGPADEMAESASRQGTPEGQGAVSTRSPSAADTD